MQKAFFKVLHYAAQWPAAQGKGSLFLYPALTSQQGARTAPCWFDVLGYSLPPFQGWHVLGIDYCGSDFHFWVIVYHQHQSLVFTFMSHTQRLGSSGTTPDALGSVVPNETVESLAVPTTLGKNKNALRKIARIL